ncbi:MAG TPA: magnesium transporter CorA family protein [Planctomycetota bacterium]|nr:magnesium transporter CorA family protein [Planctomycetota bacterium]
MQKCYRLTNGKLVEVPEGDGAVTVFINPTEAEKRYCVDNLKIDEHTFTSALDPDELSRVEFEPEHVAIIYSRPRIRTSQDQFVFRGGSVGAFAFKERLVLVAADDVPLFDSVPLTRVNSNLTLLLKLILGAVVHFRDHLKSISMISDDLQREINTAMENRHLIYLFTLEKSLVYYLNFIHSNSTLLERMRNSAARIGFTKDELEILDDIVIENSQCMKQAEIFSNIIASLMDARASIVGNNLNVIMRKLMLITIAIMTPSLVVALFSMNVALPFQSEWGPAFFLIVGLAAISATATLLLWGRRKT